MTFARSLIVIAVAATAVRADPDDAKALHSEGSRYYDLGQYERAIDRFERAYAISGAPELLLNIAQAFRLWGPAHCGDARTFYERYLDKRPDSTYRAEVTKRIDELRTCTPGPTTEPVTPTPVTHEPAPPHAQPQPAQPPVSPEPIADASGWRTAAWISLGVGVVGGVLGGTAAYLAVNDEDQLSKSCPQNVCQPSQTDAVNSYNHWRTTAVTSSIIGGVGLAAAAFCFWRSGGSEARPQVQAWVGVGGAGIAGTF
jgi:hypothetical protein